MRNAMNALWTIIILVCTAAPLGAGQPAPVKHPNLLLNREEIDQIRRKIKTEPWAAKQFEGLKTRGQYEAVTRDAAILYVLTGGPTLRQRSPAGSAGRCAPMVATGQDARCEG